MSINPVASVIIPARDAAPTLERTLSSLREQMFESQFEVIVVDDGSRDETPLIAARHADLVTVVHNEHSQGPGAARNRGASAARAPVLAFTDADCFPTSQWLERGLDATKHSELVQGRVIPEPGVRRTPFDRSLEVEGDGGFYQTANLFVRREVFDAVGGFRDWALERRDRRRWPADRRRNRASLTPIGEDTLFAWAARRLGARSAFSPDALVHHAVVAGDVRDAIADRWHWTRDMPGLARLVPELRERTFYRRWFFADWTAQFDVALAGLLAAALTRSEFPLAAVIPYARRLWDEAASYCDSGDTRADDARRRAAFLLGAPAVDAATLAGFLVGSWEWRSLVL
jgi:glycosyltransferase involved in cell wall biosynthesis